MAPEDSINPPPFWEALSTTRVQMARIETKLDQVLSSQNLAVLKQNELEQRLYAVEQIKVANAAALTAVEARVTTVTETLAAYDISPPQFKIWKTAVDAVVETYKNGVIAIKTQTEIRKADLARIGTVAGVLGGFIGLVGPYVLPALLALL